MSSEKNNTAADKQKPENSATTTAEEQRLNDKNGQQLGSLEEDDEFEEFEAEGKIKKKKSCKKLLEVLKWFYALEWEENDEENNDDSLWEDNWDDDDVEQDFASVIQ